MLFPNRGEGGPPLGKNPHIFPFFWGGERPLVEMIYLYSPNFGQIGRWSPWVGTLSLGSKRLKKLQGFVATFKFDRIKEAFDFYKSATWWEYIRWSTKWRIVTLHALGDCNDKMYESVIFGRAEGWGPKTKTITCSELGSSCRSVGAGSSDPIDHIPEEPWCPWFPKLPSYFRH